MQVKLYRNYSTRLHVNKNITHVQNINDVALLEPFNEETPEVRFSVPLPKFDYMEIEGKFYFVTGIEHETDELTTVTGELDYLYTFRDVINNATAYIDRASSGINNLIPDREDVVQVNTIQEITRIDDGFRDDEESGTYILITSQRGYS